jgi:hypothetical protein
VGRAGDAVERAEQRRDAEIDQVDIGHPEHEVSGEHDALREDVVDDVE